MGAFSDMKKPTKELALELYRQMLLIRTFETRAGELCRKGEMPAFVHLYVGEEATAVGVSSLLELEDVLTSTHRGHGHVLAKGGDPRRLMAELYGRATGLCGGRGGTMHLFAPEIGVLGTNGFVGGGIPSAVGAALTSKLLRTRRVAAAFFGDGAINHAAFHESMNLAAAWKAPVIFICENNLYATATPFKDVTGNVEVASRAASYGMPGEAVDGQDVWAVRAAAARAIERAREGKGPTLIESKTYRFVGHHEGDPVVGTYRSAEELEEWRKRDPLVLMEKFLEASFHLPAPEKEAIAREVAAVVEEAVAFARESPWPDPSTLEAHVVQARKEEGPRPKAEGEGAESTPRQISNLEAVRSAIAAEMRLNPRIIILGEGTGKRGGSFAHTKGLYDEFGAERLIDTPISELGFTGASVGAAVTGMHPIADLMFADFLSEAMSQLINQAAKSSYMSNGALRVPLVVRAAMGSIKGAAAHHSGCLYPLFMHIPGLKVVTYSSPADGYGLMRSALRDPNPVIFLDHKALYAVKGEAPPQDLVIPLGRSKLVREGADVTVVAVALMVHRALEALAMLEGISVELIDPRTLSPLDIDTIFTSVRKTGRLLIVDESYPSCSFASEVAAQVASEVLYDLDAPIRRLNSRPVTHPFSPILEQAMVPQAKDIARAIQSLMEE